MPCKRCPTQHVVQLHTFPIPPTWPALSRWLARGDLSAHYNMTGRREENPDVKHSKYRLTSYWLCKKTRHDLTCDDDRVLYCCRLDELAADTGTGMTNICLHVVEKRGKAGLVGWSLRNSKQTKGYPHFLRHRV